MEKLNIAELLKDCPSGMELDCTMYDGVEFMGIDTESDTIILRIGNIFIRRLNKYGQDDNIDCAKCVIFPKGKKTWEGFQRPFKDGDVLAYQYPPYTNPSIYIHKYSRNFNTAFYVALSGNGDFKVSDKYRETLYGNDSSARFATEEEKQKLFDAIKANGYRWNDETKTLEKLIVPKFKVGDRITNNKVSITIGYIDDEYYYEIGRNIANRLFIKNQDDWELVPNKFDITTLVPFESKVLARQLNGDYWRPAFYGCHNKQINPVHSFLTTFGLARQCIPFEGNQHLLGTTDDCDDYYKTWE